MAIITLLSIILILEGISGKDVISEKGDLFRSHVLGQYEPQTRVHRSAFLDPNEVGVKNTHDEMHHMDRMASHGNKNTTNVQNADPHDKNKQFCVDISEYLDLKWVIKESEECHVNFNRQRFILTYLNLSFLSFIHICTNSFIMYTLE